MILENGHDLIHVLAIIIETGNCRSETDIESSTENNAVTRYFIKVL